MIIYLITNKINKKQYVGQTRQTLSNRWKFHCSKFSQCSAIKAAINKYGKENFSIETIHSALSLEDLNLKEEKFINEFNTLAPNGYNLKNGGNRPVMSEISKIKMSISKIGKMPWNKGLTKEDPRVASYIRYGEENGSWKRGPMTGKSHSEESKLKISKSKMGQSSPRKGKKNSKAHIKAIVENRKKIVIICNETGKVYNSIRLASEEFNVKVGNIYGHLYGQKKNIKGHTFSKLVK